MINIDRTPESPQSLTSIEIQHYLDSLEAYKEDQQLPKDQQTISKPVSKESWRGTDLFERFDNEFHAKCYLTEQKFVTSWAMDVEHFVSRTENPNLTYTWSNLYPAEHAANMMKPRRTPVGGYLDPCNPLDDVESELLYLIDFGGQAVHFQAQDRKNQKAVNTANLLKHLHNGSSPETINRTKDLRFAIYKKYEEVLRWMNKWRVAEKQGNAEEEFKAKSVLQGLLSRRSAFTMLMRSIETVKDLPDDFFD
ncbi:hypothetical protein [Larkinella terrae]|uniref:TIGR02646 family protein n=1 Tax=Larkinella terrae TaxID=2025311 RepID=A0A7K0EL55_9BACT|nr:hypothetical protein [Larkinella terrae]MRS62271.1 hypothetical protein [Larkinella terrae]